MTRNGQTYRVGADIGGTFTDLVLLGEDGRVVLKKVPSTVEDYSKGIAAALNQALSDQQAAPGAVDEVVHGTTVATNAILEHKGSRTGLITTEGFRDLLEIRRLRMPKLYQLDWQKPPVLVERLFRREVEERIGSEGEVLVPLAREAVLKEGQWLVDQGVESLAVTFLNSYVNPEHEIAAGAILREAFPDLPISLSAEILPEIQEYERTSTTVVNAYVRPTVQGYVNALRETLRSDDVTAPLLIMQSNGGTMSARAAAEAPVRIIESGPAAGVIACQQLAERCGYPNVISFDMGGTTAKASLIEDGKVQQAIEYEVGGGVSVGSRLSRGGGYVVRVPSIDIAEVGAGGGSLVSFDKAGGIQVGPMSAGAAPGPVCYGMGNQDPTVTDANVALGYINPSALAGGTLPIDGDASVSAVAARVAKRLGSSVVDAAFGIHRIANASMIRALRSVTVERGRDPSEFILWAYGGSGPVHAADIARTMEIGTVVVPPSPGLFSAFGLLRAQAAHHLSRSIKRPLSELTAEALADYFVQLDADAEAGANDPEYPLHDYVIRRSLDLQYVGQAAVLTITGPDGPITRDWLDAVVAGFYAEYERTYGFHSPGETIEIVNARVVAQASRAGLESWFETSTHTDVAAAAPQRARQAYFGAEPGTLETPVITRSELGRQARAGPLIIEEYDATTVVPPDCAAALDAMENIVVTVGRR